jgi:hypothetical protein
VDLNAKMVLLAHGYAQTTDTSIQSCIWKKKNQVYTLPGAGGSAGKNLVKFKIPNLCNIRKIITD